MMRPLDHASVALGGMNLIEASAGTGKTHAIGSLYLRLLVEKDLLPESILVVTYTEAASAELRGRIRGRIRDALEALRDPLRSAEALPAIGSGAAEVGAEEAAWRLERALGAFDTAAVHTIHAFCLRALQEHAFESGSLYDTELGTDQHQLLRSIVDDFWRRRFFGADSPLSGYLGWRKDVTPDAFAALLGALRPGPLTRTRPEFTPGDDTAAETRVEGAYRALGGLWATERECVVAILTDDPGLSRAAGAYKKEELPALFAEMDAYLEGGAPYAGFSGMERFTAAFLGEATKKKHTTPAHPFFEAAGEMHEALERRLLVLKAELVDYYRESLPDRKTQENIRFFDDLLGDLYLALGGADGGGRLGGVLRTAYRAALIDEFQDTDPVQYEIFRRIYAGSDLPLFLIGDPKQAIYSFRGADLFAYLKAAASVDEERRFTLEKNWRSAPLLLEGFNRLFENGRNPFLYPDIAYRPLTSGGGGPAGELHDENAALPEPLQVWMLDSSGGKGGCLTVEAAERTATEAVAGEIVRLLGDGRRGTACIGERPVSAGDIAVIVRTHQQGRRMQEALRARRVPAVMRSDMSVTGTPIAREVLLLLEALADPSAEGRIRSALATPILGRTANEIAAMEPDGALWIGLLRDFAEWHRLWQSKGFMTMIRDLMRREGVRKRVLANEGGERTLTDLLHCFELIHGFEHAGGAGPEGVVSWFGERIEDESGSADAFQIRLETDRPAVRIVTVHVSKGLQYPVVFCPFLWKSSPTDKLVASFHEASGEAVRDFGSPGFDRGLMRAGEESLAEDLRLFYVALTRAEHRCCFISARIAAGVSAVNWLLHAAEASKGGAEGAPGRLREAMGGATPQAMEQELREAAGSSGGAVGFRVVGEEDLDFTALADTARESEDSPERALRRFRGRIDRSWMVSSFSSISRHGHGSAELPDRDEAASGRAERDIVPDEAATGIFGFPKGRLAGDFLHGIFEQLDFSAPSPETIRALTASGLDRYGFEPEWCETVAGAVERVLRAPLGEPDRPFRLGELSPGSWTTELEFFMPMGALSRERLAGPLRRHGVSADGVDYGLLAGQLEFQPVRGMLMGFMDMVFEAGGRYWLLDWKSNHLGNTASCYDRERMESTMVENRYHLQYLLYLAALDRHLALRVPGYTYQAHFGGVIYLFLRGVEPGDGETGIYRVRPPETLIRELTTAIAGEGAA